MDSLFFAFLDSRSSHSFVVGSSIRKKTFVVGSFGTLRFHVKQVLYLGDLSGKGFDL